MKPIARDRPPQPPASMFDDVAHDSDHPWRRWARIGVQSGFVLIVLAGLVGLFDLGGSKQAELGEARVDVDFPVSTRAGMDLRVAVTITSDEPLPDTIRMEIDREYLAMFEDLLFVPEALDQSALDNEIMRLEYEVPDGMSEVYLTIEGRAGDQWEPRTEGTLRLYASDGSETSIDIATWRLP